MGQGWIRICVAVCAELPTGTQAVTASNKLPLAAARPKRVQADFTASSEQCMLMTLHCVL